MLTEVILHLFPIWCLDKQAGRQHGLLQSQINAAKKVLCSGPIFHRGRTFGDCSRFWHQEVAAVPWELPGLPGNNQLRNIILIYAKISIYIKAKIFKKTHLKEWSFISKNLHYFNNLLLLVLIVSLFRIFLRQL